MMNRNVWYKIAFSSMIVHLEESDYDVTGRYLTSCVATWSIFKRPMLLVLLSKRG